MTVGDLKQLLEGEDENKVVVFRDSMDRWCSLKNHMDNGRGYIVLLEDRDATEKPYITACRDKALEDNLPLYFVYNEERGVLDVYITETKELFERMRCSTPLSNHEFVQFIGYYLDIYSVWKGGEK